MKSLLEDQGFIPHVSLREVVERCQPGRGALLQSQLWRRAWTQRSSVVSDAEREGLLVQKLATLVSARGTDVLLTAPTMCVPKFQRLRSSVPAGLWGWKTVCGLRWRRTPGRPEHINKLELRALFTALKWRIQKQQRLGHRFLHLTDSMVSLLVTNTGRSSSRKLRLVLQRMCAYLLASGNVCLLGYINTDQNPADRPSRRR